MLPGDLIVNVNDCIFERRDPSAGPAEAEMRARGVARLSDLMVTELRGGPNNESRGSQAQPSRPRRSYVMRSEPLLAPSKTS